MNENYLNKCINYYNFRNRHPVLAFIAWSSMIIFLLSNYFLIIPKVFLNSIPLNTSLDGKINALGILSIIFACSIFITAITLISSKIYNKLDSMYEIGKKELNKETL